MPESARDHPPTYWFWLFEVSVERKDQATAEKAKRALAELGYQVEVGKKGQVVAEQGRGAA